jgi:hypothetical protein
MTTDSNLGLLGNEATLYPVKVNLPVLAFSPPISVKTNRVEGIILPRGVRIRLNGEATWLVIWVGSRHCRSVIEEKVVIADEKAASVPTIALWPQC